MSEQTIYQTLRAAGMTRAGACGLMGNMLAESGLCAAIAQRGMTALSDAQYTAAADAGQLDFVHDAVGYGLCQWTYFSRKAALLAFARERGVSVGDEETQVLFCLRELRTEYPRLWETLCASDDLLDCARAVCVEYERPAVNNIDTRRRFAEELAARLEEPAAPVRKPDLSVLVLQAVLRFNGYEIEPDGRKSAAFFERLREFTADMEAC